MSSLQLYAYNGLEVRTQLIDGEPWFVIADICKVLDLSNPTMAAQTLDADDLSTTEVMDSMGRKQSARTTNESGVYQLVFQSRKPSARDFRRWVTKEVLPAIRKTGSYGVAAPTELSRIQILQMAMDAEQKNLALEAQVAADAPKVAYVEQFVAADDRITFRTLSGNLGVKEIELRALLVAKHWIYCEVEQRWSNTAGKLETRNRYSAYSDKKPYFQNVLNHDAPRFKGGDVMHTLKITPAGAEAIARLHQKAVPA